MDRLKFSIVMDKMGKNFIFTVPFHMNHLPRNAPSRRFIKCGGYWLIQGLKLNCKYLNDMVLHLPGLVVGPGVREYVDNKIRVVTPEVVPFPLNYAFKFDPYGKQLEALNFTWDKKCAFLDMEMGTGKSKIYIDTCVARYMRGDINAVVFLTKFTLTENILNEVKKHCPLKESDYSCHTPEFVTKSDKKKAEEFLNLDVPLKFLSVGLESISGKEGGGNAYDYLHRFVFKHKCAVIVDESHLIKNINSNRTKNSIELGKMAVIRRAGTGTPVSQGPFDLYAQYEFLDPEIIGSGNFYSFKARYGVKGGYENREIIGYDNLPELMELIKPYTFQVTKEEMVDLPPKVYMEPIRIPMSGRQKEIYESIKKSKSFELSHMREQPVQVVINTILEVYLLLQQVCAGFVSYWDEGTEGRNRVKEWIIDPKKNPKYIEALDLINGTGGQFNIWSRHVMEILAFTEFLKSNGITVTSYYGGMNGAERDKAKSDFMSGAVQCMVSNPDTGGTGLTFTNSNDVIYLSNDFKLINRLQSEDRNHRIGTTKAVSYTDIIMNKSVEQTVLLSLSNKKDVAEYVRTMLSTGCDVLNV